MRTEKWWHTFQEVNGKAGERPFEGMGNLGQGAEVSVCAERARRNTVKWNS